MVIIKGEMENSRCREQPSEGLMGAGCKSGKMYTSLEGYEASKDVQYAQLVGS